MLNINDTNINYNATSTDGDNVIANMSSSYSGTDIYFSFNLVSKIAKDVTTAKTDFAAFIDRVVSDINE